VGSVSALPRRHRCISRGKPEYFSPVAGLVWHFSPHVSIRGDFLVQKLDNGLADSGLLLSPPVDLTFFGGGVELNFSSPLYQDEPMTFTMNVGAGVTSMDVDETFSAISPANGIDASYFTLTFGGQVGYQVIRTGSTKLNIFFKAQPYLIFVDSADMLPLSGLLGSDPIDSMWVLPLTLAGTSSGRLPYRGLVEGTQRRTTTDASGCAGPPR